MGNWLWQDNKRHAAATHSVFHCAEDLLREGLCAGSSSPLRAQRMHSEPFDPPARNSTYEPLEDHSSGQLPPRFKPSAPR